MITELQASLEMKANCLHNSQVEQQEKYCEKDSCIVPFCKVMCPGPQNVPEAEKPHFSTLSQRVHRYLVLNFSQL